MQVLKTFVMVFGRKRLVTTKLNALIHLRNWVDLDVYDLLFRLSCFDLKFTFFDRFFNSSIWQILFLEHLASHFLEGPLWHTLINSFKEAISSFKIAMLSFLDNDLLYLAMSLIVNHIIQILEVFEYLLLEHELTVLLLPDLLKPLLLML